MIKENRIQKVFHSLVNYSMSSAKCVIIVNNKTKKYKCLQRNECFKSIIVEEGTTEELYNALFLNNKKDDKTDVGDYKKFKNLSVFDRDHYSVTLNVVGKDK